MPVNHISICHAGLQLRPRQSRAAQAMGQAPACSAQTATVRRAAQWPPKYQRHVPLPGSYLR